MQNALLNIELDSCPKCGGALEQGYLLGKQNRIRWSVSPKGMTIFHGVPLIKLEKGFWRNSRWWFYAPSIPAKRCEQCRLVIFSYNNDQHETPKNERLASLIIGGSFVLIALVMLFVALFSWLLPIKAPVIMLIILGVISLILIFLAAILIVHMLRSDS